jgi:hypothetical protein
MRLYQQYHIFDVNADTKIANVARIMKNSLPTSAKVSKEAKECVQECVSEFISFIVSRLNPFHLKSRDSRDRRKELTPKRHPKLPINVSTKRGKR